MVFQFPLSRIKRIMLSFKISTGLLKWIFRLYPPLLFNRIWVEDIDPSYTWIRVIVFKSFLNRNANQAIFGGTIFMAADPFFVLLFHQYFNKKGYKLMAWLKSAKIDYLKPAYSSLFYEFQINKEDFIDAERDLKETGKYIRFHTVQAKNTTGEICAQVQIEVYLRDIQFFEDLKNTSIT